MTQTSELVAGRELDALVAEKVFRWSDCEWTGWEWLGTASDGTTACPIAPYSTDIAAAWQVAEQAKYASLIRVVSASGSAHDGEWSCTLRFSRYNDDACSGAAREKTASLAICRAALAAFAT